jgi:hypothetical protein
MQGFTAMTTSPQCDPAAKLDLNRVIEQELDEIVLRRRQAGFAADSDCSDHRDAGAAPDKVRRPARHDPEQVRQELVGLAFSGGGVRSASFNLGLTQALDEHGVLRHVDYLSSVSGGSYVGGMLTDLFDEVHKSGRVDESGRPDIGLQPLPTGDQPSLVRRLVQGGNYLLRPSLFANQYAIGMVLNLLPRLSLLVALGAGLAFLWRSLDFYGIRDDYLKALGLRSDFAPALLPAVVVAATWLLAWVLALCLKSTPLRRASQFLFLAAIMCLLVGGTVLVGNGDVTAERADGTQFQTTWFHTFRWPIAFLTVLGLLPVVLPRSLLRSGASPKRWLDSWIFYYTSFVLLVGVPLLVVGLFARENISGYATSRGPEFDRGDIKDNERFCAWLEEPECRPGVSLRFGKQKLPSLAEARGDLQRLQEAERVMVGRTAWSPTLYDAAPPASLPEDQHWWTWRYLRPFKPWLELARAMIPGGDNGWIAVHAKRSRQARVAQNKLLSEFNRVVLTDETIFRPLLEDARAIQQGGPWVAKLADAGALTEKDAIAGLRVRLSREPLASLLRPSDLPPSAADTAGGTAAGTDVKLKRLRDDESRLDRHRLLLEAYLPELFRSRSEIRRVSVIEYDQRHRMLWALCALAAFVISGLVIGPNLTSQHAFYRERLAKTFLNEAEDRLPEQRPPLESHQPQRAGGPYPLFGGAVSCGSAARRPEQLEAPFERFLMSPKYCGSATLGYFPTSCLDLTLADTIAISGAALTPHYFVHHFVTLIMSLLNLRLGKWLRNPHRSASRRSSPSLLRAMYGDNFQDLSERRYVLVTDGGHVENLGLRDLLERRCRVIIVSDAGSDEGLRYADFSRVLRRCRQEQGIEFLELDGVRTLHVHGRLPHRKRKQADDPTMCARIEDLCDGPAPAERRHFFCGLIRYPGRRVRESEWGLLVYVKPCLTGDEDADVCNYAINHEPFPHESTADQTFSDIQFEAYRVLGYHTGRELCAAWRGKADLRDATAFDLAALIRGFTQALPGCDRLPGLLLAATARRESSSAGETGTAAGGATAAAAAPPASAPPTNDRAAGEQADAEHLRENIRRVLSDLFDAEQRPDDVLVDAAREQKAEIFLHLLEDLGFTHPGISDRLAQLLTELDETRHGPFLCTLLETLRRLGAPSPAVLKAVERKRRSKLPGIAAAAEAALRALQQPQASPPAPAATE